MGRTSDEERKSIEQAAQYAYALLPKLQNQKIDLETRINRLQHIIAEWEAVAGKRGRRSNLAPGESQTRAERPTKTSRGVVMSHIDAVLDENHGIKEPQVREAVNNQFNTNYGRPTIYSALCRGKDEGRYEYLSDKTWRKAASCITLTNTGDRTRTIPHNVGEPEEEEELEGQLV